MLSLNEIEILCLSIEGELATSTPKFIQEQIDHIKNMKVGKSIRGISLIRRLENIKISLIKENKTELNKELQYAVRMQELENELKLLKKKLKKESK